MKRTCCALLLLLACGASTAWAKPCPAVVGLARSGAMYDMRGGAWTRQSPKVLQEVLANGCYPEDGPSPTSSVTLYVAPGVAPARLAFVYQLLDQAGWPRPKVETKIWKNSPQVPR